MYINHFLDMVAEVTQPSLGVGYEIGRAVSFEKKILCLFKPDSDKSMSGNRSTQRKLHTCRKSLTNNILVTV
jgi:hypothetical protein